MRSTAPGRMRLGAMLGTAPSHMHSEDTIDTGAVLGTAPEPTTNHQLTATTNHSHLCNQTGSGSEHGPA